MKKISLILTILCAFLSLMVLSLFWINIHNAYSDNTTYPKVHKLRWLDHNEVQQINADGTIHVELENNRAFERPFRDAIKQWNKLHIVKLKTVKPNNEMNDNDATMTLHGNENAQEDNSYHNNGNNSSEDVLGYTSNTSNEQSIGKNHFNVIVGSNVVLMNKISKWSTKQKTRVALHEVGHALGFDDDVDPHDKLLIMYGMNNQDNQNKLKISNSEKMTLRKHYCTYQKAIQHYYKINENH